MKKKNFCKEKHIFVNVLFFRSLAGFLCNFSAKFQIWFSFCDFAFCLWESACTADFDKDATMISQGYVLYQMSNSALPSITFFLSPYEILHLDKGLSPSLSSYRGCQAYKLISNLWIIPGSCQTTHIMDCWKKEDYHSAMTMTMTHTKTKTGEYFEEENVHV